MSARTPEREEGDSGEHASRAAGYALATQRHFCDAARRGPTTPTGLRQTPYASRRRPELPYPQEPGLGLGLGFLIVLAVAVSGVGFAPVYLVLAIQALIIYGLVIHPATNQAFAR